MRKTNKIAAIALAALTISAPSALATTVRGEAEGFAWNSISGTPSNAILASSTSSAGYKMALYNNQYQVQAVGTPGRPYTTYLTGAEIKVQGTECDGAAQLKLHWWDGGSNYPATFQTINLPTTYEVLALTPPAHANQLDVQFANDYSKYVDGVKVCDRNVFLDYVQVTY